MTLQDAINKADSIFTNIWMEAGVSGYEVILTKEDATKACVDFLDHEFDENEDAIYNKEGQIEKVILPNGMESRSFTRTADYLANYFQMDKLSFMTNVGK